jgi:outer membrane protein, heavy metal efflux system
MGKITRAAILLALLAGCASHADDRGFADVQQQVKDRTGQRVQWNRRSAEDCSAAAAVHDLLSRELSPDQAVQVALLNNHSLQATYEDIGIAQADLVQAGLLKNPVFTAAVEFGDAGKGTKLNFSVLEDFISILQIPLHQRVAESALAQVRLRVIGAVIELSLQTKSAFYSAQASSQTVELRRTAAQAGEASYDLARRIRAAGNSSDLDLAAQQAQLEQAKLDLAAAELEHQRLRERLASLLGVRITEMTTTERLPDLPAQEPDAKNIEQRAVDKSVNLDLSKSEVASAARALGLSKWAPLEGTELGASSEKEVDGTWETGPAVSVPLPIFDTGQAARAAARSRYAQARQRYHAEQLEIRSAARLATAELLAARARAEQYEKTIIPLRHRISDAMQTQYNGMLVGVFVVLDARREEVNAGAEYVQAKRDYWLARTRMDALLAGWNNGAQ